MCSRVVALKALRASMAIPVLFDPIKMNKTLYVDGGLTTNFPAEQCKAMGADYIIGNNAAIARVDMRVRVYKSHYLTALDTSSK